MKILDILYAKGSDIRTITAGAAVSEAVAPLATHDIGALVVTDLDGQMIGIVSERDVVRELHRRGAAALSVATRQIMTANPTTCGPATTVQQTMRTMTDKRMRHLPVVDDTGLIGIVSIGDIVKNRIDELEATTDQLTSYISG